MWPMTAYHKQLDLVTGDYAIYHVTGAGINTFALLQTFVSLHDDQAIHHFVASIL